MLELFISWSGDKSRSVALALGEWLPGVINNVRPFVSAQDIYAGTRWQVEIAGRLETAEFGIVCVTRENQLNTWLNFEAGALAKVVDATRVVPLAIDLKPSDVQIPLGQFQAQPATEDGIGRIVASINSVCHPVLAESLLARATAMWWPELKRKLDEIERQSGNTSRAVAPTRSDRELLEELLGTVRGLSARNTQTNTVALTSRTHRGRELGTILIDISNFRPDAVLHEVPLDEATTVSEVLNSVYYELADLVAPFAYRNDWILRTEGGTALDQLGSDWAMGVGNRVDDRLWGVVGPPVGSLLIAERVVRQTASASG